LRQGCVHRPCARDGCRPVRRTWFQHPEETDLHRGRDVADLVEKKGTAVRGLESSGAFLECPGKRPPDVAEELAFDEAIRESTTVDAEVGSDASRAQPMQRRSHQLLAGTRLSVDEGRGVGRSKPPDLVVDPPHRLGSAERQGEIGEPERLLRLVRDLRASYCHGITPSPSSFGRPRYGTRCASRIPWRVGQRCELFHKKFVK
jgi:hypothetical protein